MTKYIIILKYIEHECLSNNTRKKISKKLESTFLV